ncbi:hypothetical protein BgAZ_109010 [Babesia gibsoni]|uniref:Uncharacterized protein n=1 Tax=Babesia gibsoni TaxID=33632 RepID=A0AAD8PGV2_BABGI|nr:hypothetical protein BgAZ_109010 [Babesia gibsoni]
MSVCDVFLALGASVASCPKECPFWSQNAVWKNVGVCTVAENCNVYNPILNYADKTSNVCLPCAVHGCAKCEYSEEALGRVARGSDSELVLPDVCLQCAPGYRMTDEGRRCYLVNSNLWTRLLYVAISVLVLSSTALALNFLLRPGKFWENVEKYKAAMEAQKSELEAIDADGGFFHRLYAFLHVDVLGVGGILYFRFVLFMVLVTLVLLVISISHSHIRCAGMIRVFKAPFTLDKPAEVPLSHRLFSWFGMSPTSQLKEHFLNFKYVDDAIEWSVEQYANDTARTMRILYICVMICTVAFMISQRDFLLSYFKENSLVQNFTLILHRAPPLHTLEDFIQNATTVRPKSVTVAYDLSHVDDGMKEFLDVQDEDSHVYLNIEMAEEHRRILKKLNPTGTAFAVFETIQDLEVARTSLRNTGICDADYCDMEPEDVIWANIGKEEQILTNIISMSGVIVSLQVAWTFVFFLPYATYMIHSDSSDILEAMWLTIFVTVGSSIVAVSINKAIDKIEFVSRGSVASYKMWVSFVTDVINTGLSVLLAHFINYGGRFKVVSVVKDFTKYMTTPAFKVGEEVSVSMSLNSYMVNVLLFIPTFLFLYIYYGSTLITAVLVLAADLNEKQIAQFVRYPMFDFPGRFSDFIVKFTCSLLLQFVIRSKSQAIMISVSLLVGFLLSYIMDTYMIENKTGRVKINGYQCFYNALRIWSIPTGVLAACPSYWRWRSQDGKPITPFIMFFLHVSCYWWFMSVIFNCRSSFGRTEVNTSETDYTLVNPVYKLKRLTTATI